MKRRTAIQVSMLFLGCIVAASAQDRQADVRQTLELHRGISMIARGDFANAEDLFKALCHQQIDAKDTRIYCYYLSICQIELGKTDRRKYEEAARSLNEVLKGLQPGTPEYTSFSTAHLDRGLALIMAGRADQAIPLLREFKRHAPKEDRDAVLMLLGIAQYRDERYGEAVTTLRSLVKNILSPHRVAATYYTGLAQARSRRVDEAKRTLTRLRQLSTDLGQRAQTTLDQLDRMYDLELRPFYFTLTLDAGLKYDTNVVLLGRRSSFPTRISNEDDFRFGLFTDLDFDWRPQEQPLTNWHLNVGASIFETWHSSIQEFDFQNYAADFYLGRTVWESDRFVQRVELGIRYDYDYSLLGNDGFLSRNALALVGNIRENDDKWTTGVEYQWQIRDYEEDIFSDRFDRDGNYQSVGIFQEFDLTDSENPPTGPVRFLSLAFGYRHEDNSTQGSEFDFDSNTVFAGVTARLPWKVYARLDAEFEWQDYWQRSLIDFDRSGREDFIQRYRLQLSRRINPWLTIRGLIAWTYDDSNVKNRLGEEVFSYDRLIYGLTARVELLNPHERRAPDVSESAK